tara:strand:- start:10106 stop:11035 length:930 start_codon:yes stop_codon:yes gene_type:complete
MARHLIIGDGTTRSTANPVEDGAVTIQKMSASGPTDLILGETILNAPMIRIVGGGKDGKNIVTPWIYGKDVVNWGGKTYLAAAACTVTDTIAATSAAAGTLVLKLVKTSGPRIEFFTFSTVIAASVANTAADALIKTAFEDASLVKPDWLNPVCNATAGATVVFSGAIRGDVAYGGNTWDYEPVQIKLIVESYDGGTQTHTASATTGGSTGNGGGFAIRAFEESLQGTSHGFYMRGHLPKQPSLESATGSNYDVYNIVATKDGSSASQINGVDNLIEINLALIDGDVDSKVVEKKLNAYFAGVFPLVIL